MKITRENYESFFLDYLEGRMSPDDEVELKRFLREHPELKEELDRYPDLKLTPPEASMPGRSLLVKNLSEHVLITPDSLDEFSIACLEGDLSPARRSELFKYLEKNPGEKAHFDAIQKAVLRPRRGIRFPGKASLKRFTLLGWHRKALIPYLSAAASVVILIGFYLILKPAPSGPESNTQLAQVDTTRTSVTIPPVERETEPASTETGTQPVTQTPETGTAPTATPAPAKKKVGPVITIEIADAKGGGPGRTTTAARAVSMELLQARQTGMLASATPDPSLQEPKPVMLPEGETADYLTVRQYAILQFKKNILEEDPGQINTNRFSVWDIADAGIRGLNQMTGWNMQLEKEYSPDGNIEALAFNSKAIQVSHTPKK